MLPAKRHRHHNTNHPEYKVKLISFFFPFFFSPPKLKLEAFTNCQSLKVKSSKTDNENA